MKLEGLKFGDIVRNNTALDDDPHKVSVFIRYANLEHNPLFCTDMEGDFFSVSNYDKQTDLVKVGSIFNSRDKLLEALRVINSGRAIPMFEYCKEKDIYIKGKDVLTVIMAITGKAIALAEKEIGCQHRELEIK